MVYRFSTSSLGSDHKSIPRGETQDVVKKRHDCVDTLARNLARVLAARESKSSWQQLQEQSQ